VSRKFQQKDLAMKRYATIAALLITTALPLASAASAAPQPMDQYRGPDFTWNNAAPPANRAYGSQNQSPVVFRGSDGVTWNCITSGDTDYKSAYPSWDVCR
jgi:hypothetical protein